MARDWIPIVGNGAGQQYEIGSRNCDGILIDLETTLWTLRSVHVHIKLAPPRSLFFSANEPNNEYIYTYKYIYILVPSKELYCLFIKIASRTNNSHNKGPPNKSKIQSWLEKTVASDDEVVQEWRSLVTRMSSIRSGRLT